MPTVWGAAPRPSRARARYPACVSENDERIGELRRLLDAELDRRIGPQWGCWPLLVGLLGVLLGLALLAERF